MRMCALGGRLEDRLATAVEILIQYNILVSRYLRSNFTVQKKQKLLTWRRDNPLNPTAIFYNIIPAEWAVLFSLNAF